MQKVVLVPSALHILQVTILALLLFFFFNAIQLVFANTTAYFFFHIFTVNEDKEGLSR